MKNCLLLGVFLLSFTGAAMAQSVTVDVPGGYKVVVVPVIVISRHAVIPDGELEITAIRSQGAGGQHVNNSPNAILSGIGSSANDKMI